MAPKCENKATNKEKEIENEETSSVFWLKKIYEKMDQLDVNNNSALKQIEQRLDSLTNEVKAVKIAMTQMESIVKQGNSTKLKVIEENEVFPKNEGARREFFSALNKRKHTYYKKLRSTKIATVYRGFLEQTPPFIPKKFREGHMPGESEKQKERINSLEKTKLELECERLEEEISKQENDLMEIEKEVSQVISKEGSLEESQKLKETWIRKIQEEERVSENIWEKKKTYFENLKNNEMTRNNYPNRRTNQRHKATESRIQYEWNHERPYNTVQHRPSAHSGGRNTENGRNYSARQFFRGTSRTRFGRYSGPKNN